MQRIAFKMKLFPGCKNEYKKRHDEIWPELKQLFAQKGVHDFSIFIDEETNTLFAFLTIHDPLQLNDLPNEPVQKRWWAYMKDIMETNADNSPVRYPLTELFYLP